MPRARRENRGGPRQGVVGRQYGNRTDLANSERVPSPQVRAAAQQGAVAAQQRQPMPQVTPLTAESQRPDEPVTAGLPFGPGAGPEALAVPGMLGPLEKLKRMYRANPNPDLLELIILAEGQ